MANKLNKVKTHRNGIFEGILITPKLYNDFITCIHRIKSLKNVKTVLKSCYNSNNYITNTKIQVLRRLFKSNKKFQCGTLIIYIFDFKLNNKSIKYNDSIFGMYPVEDMYKLNIKDSQQVITHDGTPGPMIYLNKLTSSIVGTKVYGPALITKQDQKNNLIDVQFDIILKQADIYSKIKERYLYLFYNIFSQISIDKKRVIKNELEQYFILKVFNQIPVYIPTDVINTILKYSLNTAEYELKKFLSVVGKPSKYHCFANNIKYKYIYYIREYFPEIWICSSDNVNWEVNGNITSYLKNTNLTNLTIFESFDIVLSCCNQFDYLKILWEKLILIHKLIKNKQLNDQKVLSFKNLKFIFNKYSDQTLTNEKNSMKIMAEKYPIVLSKALNILNYFITCVKLPYCFK